MTYAAISRVDWGGGAYDFEEGFLGTSYDEGIVLNRERGGRPNLDHELSSYTVNEACSA